MLYQTVEAVSVTVPHVCRARDVLRVWLSAGLWRGKQEDDSGETGSQWQAYSVLCSQSMASLPLIYPDTHTHTHTQTHPVLLHCSENIIITSSSRLTGINFMLKSGEGVALSIS